jgi:hypothetical protein
MKIVKVLHNLSPVLLQQIINIVAKYIDKDILQTLHIVSKIRFEYNKDIHYIVCGDIGDMVQSDFPEETVFLDHPSRLVGEDSKPIFRNAAHNSLTQLAVNLKEYEEFGKARIRTKEGFIIDITRELVDIRDTSNINITLGELALLIDGCKLLGATEISIFPK